MLSITGFNSELDVQGDDALFGIRILLAALPALLVLLLAFIVSRYHLTDAQLVEYGKEIELKGMKYDV